MIYVSGDTHGTFDVNKFIKIKPHLTEDDYILVLGDSGVCWDNNGSDLKTRRFWERNKSTVLFIDGNHENFDLLNALPVAEWNGGKVHKIGEKIIHLMRGQIFELDGKIVFTFGGAASHDCGPKLDKLIAEHIDDFHEYFAEHKNIKLPRGNRQPGKDWWAAELPSAEEIAVAKDNLAKYGNKVDYILTHTPSSRVLASRMFEINPQSADQLAFFDWIEENVKFEHFWSGHLHEDFYYDDRHIGFYEQIRVLE